MFFSIKTYFVASNNDDDEKRWMLFDVTVTYFQATFVLLLLFEQSMTTESIEFEPKVGDRVTLAKNPSILGTVRFVGATDFASGPWCGKSLAEQRHT
jgi:hypothetical protein